MWLFGIRTTNLNARINKSQEKSRKSKVRHTQPQPSSRWLASIIETVKWSFKNATFWDWARETAPPRCQFYRESKPSLTVVLNEIAISNWTKTKRRTST